MSQQAIVVLWTLIAAGSVAASVYALADAVRSLRMLRGSVLGEDPIDRAARVTASANLRRELLRLVFDAVFLAVGIVAVVAPPPQAPPSATANALRVAFVGAYAVLFAQKVLDVVDGRRVMAILAEAKR